MSNWKIRRAVATLKGGGIIAYPTESVYGLGCNPWNEQAVARILTIKQRSWKKGFILIAANFNQLQDFIQPVPEMIMQKLNASWPGATTWLLVADTDTPPYLSGIHDTIAVRVTAHRQTHDLCQHFGGAIISTSANITGMRPAKAAHHVRLRLSDIDYLLSGHCSGADLPSTIKNAHTGKIIR